MDDDNDDFDDYEDSYSIAGDDNGWDVENEDINKEYAKMDGEQQDSDDDIDEEKENNDDDIDEFINEDKIINEKNFINEGIKFRTSKKMYKYEHSRTTETLGKIINLYGKGVPDYVIEEAKQKYGDLWDRSDILANIWINNPKIEPPIALVRYVGNIEILIKISNLISFNDVYTYSGGYGL